MKPALRRILRDEHTLQYGVHPLRAITLTGLTRSVRQWIEGLDGTRDLRRVMRDAAAAGLDEPCAQALLDYLATRGALQDAGPFPAPLRELSLAERDRLKPDLDALDLASNGPQGGVELLRRRREAKVRVYGAGRVGAQIVALLAAGGVGDIRVIDPGPVRPGDITPGGLTWAEVGLSREEGAAAVARRLLAPPPKNAPAVPPPRDHASPPRHAGPNATPAGDVAGRRARGAPSPSGGTTAQPRLADITPSRGTTAQPRRGGITPSRGATVQPRLADITPSRGTTAQSRRPGVTPSGIAAAQASPDVPPTSAEVSQDVVPSSNVLAGAPHLGDGTARPDLAILAPVGPLDGVLVNELADFGIPHLLVSAFEGHGSVGPLVIPGETTCLHCLDLTRRDHDPAWPIVTARLGGFPPGEIACDTTLATLVAAAATGQALAHLEGRASSVTNGTMDVMPDWCWKRRSWSGHPQCRCMRNNPYSLTMDVSPTSD
ncbi:thiamine biosynthesis protein ThiF [Nonomuraea sp. NPDC001831]|uniref:thiamine biosynthesis protein ThiF n=1 Tax=Nonomuraea sp. NPDC001831 TaxID=3364340 RepID=UPI003696C5A0